MSDVTENYSARNVSLRTRLLSEIFTTIKNDILVKVGDQFLIRTGGFAAGTVLLTGVISDLQGTYTGLDTVTLAASISAAVSFLGPQLGFVATKLSGQALSALGNSIADYIVDQEVNKSDRSLKLSTLERLSKNIDYIVVEQDLENSNFWVVKTDKGKLLKVMNDDMYHNTFKPMIDQSGIRLIETSFENDGVFIREYKNGFLDCRNGPAEVQFYNNNGHYEVLYERYFINGNLFENQDDYELYTDSNIKKELTIFK